VIGALDSEPTADTSSEQEATEDATAVTSEQPAQVAPEKNNEKDFNTHSRERFDDLEAGWHEEGDELDRIECLDGDCTSVVYFRFNTIPTDPDISDYLDMVIRGNAATFSKFKLDNTGTSHVTVFATLNGQTMMQCDASKGMVDECK